MHPLLFTGNLKGGCRKEASSTQLSTLIAAIWSLCLVWIACAPTVEETNDFQVKLSFAPELSVGDTICTIQLSDGSGAPLQGAKVDVEGNMNHAGMVPSFGKAEEKAPGRYEAPLEFTMGGDWFVIVQVELADGTKRERIVDVPGVASSRGGESKVPK